MHASQNASRLAAAGLAVILLFLSGFALWGAIATDRSSSEAKRAEVISDGYRLARYSLALEDLVMTTYLTLPDYQSHRLVPPGSGAGSSQSAMPGMAPASSGPPAAAAQRPSMPPVSPITWMPGTMTQSLVPAALPSAAPAAKMPGTSRSSQGPMRRRAMGSRARSRMGSHARSRMGPHAGSGMISQPAMSSPAAVSSGLGSAAPSVDGGGDEILPTGAQLRAEHEAAAAQLMTGLQSVMLNGNAEDRRLAQDVVARHAQHMAYAMRMFQAVDHNQPGTSLWIQLHELGPSFSYIEKEVDWAAQIHRLRALRKLGDLSRTESLVFTGTIIAFAVGLVLLAGLAMLLRSYARRIEETRMTELTRLAEVALTDNLTGLRNHRAFQEDLTRQLGHRDRTGIEFSLLLLDLNGLKQVNDNFGHQKGDEQLIELARCIRRTLRQQDSAYRVGGDEFAILLTDGNAWGGLRLVERLNLELMASAVVPQPSAAVGVAESIGAFDRDTLIQHADAALLQAKRSDKTSMVYSEGLARELHAPGDGMQAAHLATLTTALARAVDAKDSYTRSHSDTVSELCGLIAAELGLEEDHSSRLRLAGLLHDVGKIGIADAILKKPAKLTPSEFEIMKTHSTLGYTIVMGAALPQEARWILHHHERYDGSGYPERLQGEEIPLESRIILVADAFEAMTSDRPYRKGRPDAEALEELDRCAGSQFDPDCVAALRRALDQHRRSEPELQGADLEDAVLVA